MRNNTAILYVDDEPINLMLLKLMLKGKYEVLTADSGAKGLELLSANPDLRIVISDMRMPNMDGLEFISQAKEKYPNIIFCILTGYEITEEIMMALESKLIYRYFQKPFKVDEIESAIADALTPIVTGE